MAELEAAHKAKQQGATRWREASEFASLLEFWMLSTYIPPLSNTRATRVKTK
jgi:hypothetical protein